MMAIGDHIHITIAIETFQLAFDPVQLLIIRSNIGIKRDDKSVAIAKRISWITRQSPRCTIRRNKLRDSCKIITQAILPAGIIELRCRRDIVVAGCEKIRDAAFGGQAIDQIHKTRIPLPGLAAVNNGVTG